MLEKITIWKDAFANNIDLYCYTCNPLANDNILLVGRFHGDEPEGEVCLQYLLENLKNANLHSPYNIYILPCLNPSGKAKNTRANGNGIDLNRNYPTQNFTSQSVNPHTKNLSAGTPASEIETKIMMQLVRDYSFKRILSIHSDLHLVDYDGPAQELALRFSNICGYRLVDNIGYPTNGSFGTWAGIEQQIPLLTVETWHAKDENDMHKIWNELQPAIFDFCQLK